MEVLHPSILSLHTILTLKRFKLRLLSKLLDLLFYYGLSIGAQEFIYFSSSPIVIVIISLFIINAVLEALTGTTLGKLLIGFEVVNTCYEKPSFLKVFAKNIL
jgi:hypothetical protein